MIRNPMRLAALAASAMLALACKKGSDHSSTESEVAIPANDLLAGAGQFRGTLAADTWHFQAPDGATYATPVCKGFTATCAQLAGADLGAEDIDAQLVYWDAANDAPRYVTLHAGKKYTIQLRGSASAASTAVKVQLVDSVYLVPGESGFTLGTTPADYAGDAIQLPAGSGDKDVSVRVNVGGTANAGASVSLDDLYVIEEDASVTPPPPGSNLLTDGDMENSPSTAVWNRWAQDGSNAAFAIEDCSADGFTGKCFKSSGSNWGANPWSTQLIQWNGASDPQFFPLSTGKTYTIKFRGRATAAGGVAQVMIQGAAPGYATPVSHDFDLTSTAADYEFAFGLSEAQAGALAFKMGFISPTGTAQEFEIDDLQLVEQ